MSARTAVEERTRSIGISRSACGFANDATMTEKKFQTEFNRWLKNKWKRGPAVFELKLTKKSAIPFADVKPHQVAALLEAQRSGGGFAYKIPDVGFDQKPFDCAFFSGTPAYVVICYYQLRASRIFLIPVDTWIVERDVLSERKSLTLERVMMIGEEIVFGATEKPAVRPALRVS